MPYIATTFNQTTQLLDYAISNDQILTGDALATAFLIALFTANVQTPTTDIWWGSTYTAYPIGSKLPLLIRGVKSGNGAILLQAKDYAKQALQQFLDIGVITSLAVSTRWITSNGTAALGIAITVTEAGQTDPVLITYGLVGDGTAFIVTS